MLSIALIQTQNYLGRGAEYVARLRQGIARNFTRQCRVYVITDDVASNYPGAHVKPAALPGWWEKIRLFKPGMFPEGRVIFLDLDTVIVGDIDFLADYDGDFATLSDFWRPEGLGPAVMLWQSGFGAHFWRAFEEAGRPMTDPRGDQWFLEQFERPDILQDLYPGAFVSYKTHCTKAVPADARVVCFHGRPRPHEVSGVWNGE